MVDNSGRGVGGGVSMVVVGGGDMFCYLLGKNYGLLNIERQENQRSRWSVS